MPQTMGSHCNLPQRPCVGLMPGPNKLMGDLCVKTWINIEQLTSVQDVGNVKLLLVGSTTKSYYVLEIHIL